MGMRLWTPALWPNANSCLAPMEPPQVWSQLPWVINILKKLYLKTEEKWPYYKCVASYYTPSGKKKKWCWEKPQKCMCMSNVLAFFSSLRGPPEVWHHSWIQLSLDIFVLPARGRYHLQCYTACLVRCANYLMAVSHSLTGQTLTQEERVWSNSHQALV